jgi:hypothetical protein
LIGNALTLNMIMAGLALVATLHKRIATHPEVAARRR